MPESMMPLTEDMMKDIYNSIVEKSSTIISHYNPLTIIGTYDELRESIFDPRSIVYVYLKFEMMFGFAGNPDKKIKVYNQPWPKAADGYKDTYITDDDIMMFALCSWLNDEDIVMDFIFNKIFDDTDIAYVIDFYSEDITDHDFYDVNHLRLQYIDSEGKLQTKWIDWPTKFNLGKFIYAMDHELLSFDFAFYNKDDEQDILSDFDRTANWYAIKTEKTIDKYLIEHLDMPEDIKNAVTDNFWRLMIAPY